MMAKSLLMKLEAYLIDIGRNLVGFRIQKCRIWVIRHPFESEIK